MTLATIHWLLNLGTFLGVLILAVPVWSLNSRKKKLQAIRDSLPQTPTTFRDNVRAILTDKRNRDVADWRRIDEVCLIVGYGLLLGSSALRLCVAPA